MSTLEFDNIKPSAGGTARKAVRGIAAAWANLNGTGTIALRDSENVSSVVDNGTGDYTNNFSNALASINYTMLGYSTASISGSPVVADFQRFVTYKSPATGSVRYGSANAGGTSFEDAEFAGTQISGDLA